MTLDNLYGAGAKQLFANTLDLSAQVPNLTVEIKEGNADNPGGVQIEAVWRNSKGIEQAWLTLSFYPTFVWYAQLQLREAIRFQGVLSHFAETHQTFFRNHGVLAMVCTPGNEASQAALEAVGFRPGEWESQQRLLIRL